MTKNPYSHLSSRAFRTQPRNTYPQARPIAGRFGSFANRDQTPNASPAAVGCAARVARRSSAPSAATVHTPPPEATRAHRPRQHRRDSQARRARPRPRRASCTRASECSPTLRAARGPRARAAGRSGQGLRPRRAARARARRVARRLAAAQAAAPLKRVTVGRSLAGATRPRATAAARSRPPPRAPRPSRRRSSARIASRRRRSARLPRRASAALLPQFVVPETFTVVGALCGLAAKDPPASARLALELAYEMRALVLLDGARRARARGVLSSTVAFQTAGS